MNLFTTFFLSACFAWFRGEPDPSLLLQKYIRSGTQEEVSSALKAGADPSSVGADGRTPLMVAAASGDLAFIDLLLAARARVDGRDPEGRTALDLAHGSGHKDAALVLASARVPGNPGRFPLQSPLRESRTFPTAPFPVKEAACLASVAMADIALARACPAGMVELVPSQACECEAFMNGLSCRRSVAFSCQIPSAHGGLDVIHVDPRGAQTSVPPIYNVRVPAFVVDVRPAANFLPPGRTGSLSIVLAKRDAGKTILWEQLVQSSRHLYTVRPPVGLSAPGDYVLAIVEDTGAASSKPLWLARVFTIPRTKP